MYFKNNLYFIYLRVLRGGHQKDIHSGHPGGPDHRLGPELPGGATDHADDVQGVQEGYYHQQLLLVGATVESY